MTDVAPTPCDDGLTSRVASDDGQEFCFFVEPDAVASSANANATSFTKAVVAMALGVGVAIFVLKQ